MFFVLNLLNTKVDVGCQQSLVFMSVCKPRENILSRVFYGVFVIKCLYWSEQKGASRTFKGFAKTKQKQKEPDDLVKLREPMLLASELLIKIAALNQKLQIVLRHAYGMKHKLSRKFWCNWRLYCQ